MFQDIFESLLKTRLQQALINDGVKIEQLGPATDAFINDICKSIENIKRPPCRGVEQKTPGKKCNYLSRCGEVCNKCGQVHGT